MVTGVKSSDFGVKGPEFQTFYFLLEWLCINILGSVSFCFPVYELYKDSSYLIALVWELKEATHVKYLTPKKHSLVDISCYWLCSFSYKVSNIVLQSSLPSLHCLWRALSELSFIRKLCLYWSDLGLLSLLLILMIWLYLAFSSSFSFCKYLLTLNFFFSLSFLHLA